MDYTDVPAVHKAMWEKLEDIDCDVDHILHHAKEESKMDNFDSGLLAGMLNNNGINAGELMALLGAKDREGGWGEAGGIWIILLFLFMLGMGGNGIFGNRNGGVDGVDRTVVNEANYSRLLDAVGTQGTRQEMAIQSLANTLNCDVQTIEKALCDVRTQLVANQGSFENAIQSCCCSMKTEMLQVQNSLQSQIAKCCCDTNLNIERQGCQTRQDIQETRFLIQTTDAATRQLIQQQFCDQNAYLADQFCQIKMREDQREIQALRDRLDEQRDNANTALIINAINGQKCINARYNTDTQSICGSVGSRSCCCGNRVGSSTPASAETATKASTKTKTKAKSE